MAIVPFIYFTALTVYWWFKHRSLDVCVYMSALYAITAFCAAVIVYGDMLNTDYGILFDRYDVELGIIPTLLYCGLITLTIFPFSLIYNKEIQSVSPPSSLLLEGLCWLLFFVFFINFYLIADSTLEILSGDLSTVRTDHYEGLESPADIKAQSMPTIFGYILYFRHVTILGLPLFFYYECFSNKSWWFKALLIATSFTMPLYGMQMADRTEFTFYGMMFIFCLVFFWKFLTRKFKRRMCIIGSPFVLAILIYLIAVSQARFSQNDDGERAYESVFDYVGQNYLNFCFFWEKANFEHIAAERELPFTHHLLYGVDSNAERREERSGKQGFFISVFPTFAGDIMLDITPVGVVIWCMIFFVFSLSLIRYAHKETYDVGDILAIFTLAAVPIFGIFYYRYYFVQSIYLFIAVATIFLVSKFRIIYK